MSETSRRLAEEGGEAGAGPCGEAAPLWQPLDPKTLGPEVKIDILRFYRGEVISMQLRLRYSSHYHAWTWVDCVEVGRPDQRPRYQARRL